MDGATANARRKYHHVHHGGKLTEHDIAGMVRGMENKDAEIARLRSELERTESQWAGLYDKLNLIARKTQTERDQALARAAAAAMEMRERSADAAEDYCSDMPDLAGHGHSVGIKDRIRTLPIGPIDPDSQKALDKMLVQAREDAIREAADIVNKNRDISGWVSHDAILALINDGGRDE